MVDAKVIQAIGMGVVGILVLLLVMGIFTPMSLTSQDRIMDTLNESVGLDVNNNSIGKYVSNADILSAKQDTGNLIVNIPTFMWLSLLFLVLAGIGFSVFVVVKGKELENRW